MFGRKKNKSKSKNRYQKEKGLNRIGLKAQTARSAVALVSFALSTVLLLASISKAGHVGDWLYRNLNLLLGLGYFLVPATFTLTGLVLLRHSENQKMLTVSQVAGIGLFLISSLGIMNIVTNNGGGLLGVAIASPVIALLDTPATIIILLTFFLVAVIILFDLELSRILKATPVPITALVGTLSRKIFNRAPDNHEEPVIIAEPAPEPDSASQSSEQDIETDNSARTEEKESHVANTDKAGDGTFSLAKLDYSHSYVPPPHTLLEGDRGKPSVGDIKANTNIIKRTLSNFGISVEMDEVSIGPSVTRYALKPAEGVKLARIVGLKNDLALALAAHPIRIEAPIPGKSLVGIEIPNTSKATVGMSSLMSLGEFKNSPAPLMITLGKSITGKGHFANLSKMPHMLIAGATGSGKSVTIHALVNSLLFRNSPETLQMILVDPKRVELTLYNGLPHLLTPVITQAKQALLALKWVTQEMDRRYDILESQSVRDIDSYHHNIVFSAYNEAEKRASKKKDSSEKNPYKDLPERMPFIVVIIDELADLMQTYPRELEASVVRIAQMSRAVGIHLVLSTQRPSVNVITGLIKANIPARIALQVASQVDSRTILDMSGAESLLGAGDMLFMSGEMSKPTRLQSAYISEKEVKQVVNFIKKQYSDTPPDDRLSTSLGTDERQGPKMSLEEMEAESDSNSNDDELYEDAREVIISAKKASTSLLQRKLRIGYGRAARLIDMLEERGVVGPADGARGREVLIISGPDETDDNHYQTPNPEL